MMDAEKIKAEVFTHVFLDLIKEKMQPMPTGERKGAGSTAKWKEELSVYMEQCAETALVAAEVAGRCANKLD